jgi:hypothetical protein
MSTLVANGTLLYKVFRTTRGANAGTSVLATQNPATYNLAQGSPVEPQLPGTPVMVFLTYESAKAFGDEHRPNEYTVKAVQCWGDVVVVDSVLKLKQGWRDTATDFWARVRANRTSPYLTEKASAGTAGVFGIVKIA